MKTVALLKDKHGWTTKIEFDENALEITQTNNKIQDNRNRYICLNTKKEIKKLLKLISK